MRIRNLKHYKSSLLGLVLYATGIYLVINAITFDYYIIGGLFVSGTMLLFAPDVFIEKLEKFVFGKILFKNTKEDGE